MKVGRLSALLTRRLYHLAILLELIYVKDCLKDKSMQIKITALGIEPGM